MQKKIIFYLLVLALILVALVLILSYILSRVSLKGENIPANQFIGPPKGAVPYVKGPKSPPPFNN